MSRTCRHILEAAQPNASEHAGRASPRTRTLDDARPNYTDRLQGLPDTAAALSLERFRSSGGQSARYGRRKVNAMHRNHYAVRVPVEPAVPTRLPARQPRFPTTEDHMTLLDPGDRLPAVTINLADGETIKLPDALAGSYGVVLLGYLREHAALRGAA